MRCRVIALARAIHPLDRVYEGFWGSEPGRVRDWTRTGLDIGRLLLTCGPENGATGERKTKGADPDVDTTDATPPYSMVHSPI